MNSFLFAATLIAGSWFEHYYDAIEYRGPYDSDTCLPVPFEAHLFPSARCSSGLSGNLLNYLLKITRLESRQNPCDILAGALYELYAVHFVCSHLTPSKDSNQADFKLESGGQLLLISAENHQLTGGANNSQKAATLQRHWRRHSERNDVN